MKKLSIVFGPPLSGKTTFAKSNSQFHHISLRKKCNSISKKSGYIPRFVASSIEYNTFMPSYLLLPLVFENEFTNENQESLLDGYPKYSHEVDPLLYWCSINQVQLANLYLLNPSLETLLERLKNRFTCSSCYLSLQSSNRCICGGTVFVRKEDSVDYFVQRYERYQENSVITIESLSSSLSGGIVNVYTCCLVV